MGHKFVETPIEQQPWALCLELPAEMKECDVKDFIAWVMYEARKTRAAKTRGKDVTKMWYNRFDPQTMHPVFYCP